MPASLKKRITLFLSRYPAFSERSFSFQVSVLLLLCLVAAFTASRLWQLSSSAAPAGSKPSTAFISLSR